MELTNRIRNLCNKTPGIVQIFIYSWAAPTKHLFIILLYLIMSISSRYIEGGEEGKSMS